MNTFSERLIAWHRLHGRHDLPWQNTRDPYRLWLSEIMLQQTQVETVIPYYMRFLARFPTVAALAAADQQDVLTLWSGLGYYARARNLHKAAYVVVSEYGGRFPQSAEALMQLPGIGRSTAAAIAAFAYGERVAILDGNVKRVLCRIFGVEGYPGDQKVEKRLWSLAESLLPEKDRQGKIAAAMAAYTQAQMDLGATVCTRGKPACMQCPFREDCIAYRQNRWAELPEKKARKPIPRRHTRMAVLIQNGKVLLERRPPSGIWGGLLSLPEIPNEQNMADWAQTQAATLTAYAQLSSFTHTFTHFVLDIEPWLLETDSSLSSVNDSDSRYVWLPLSEATEAALPTPVRRILSTVRDSVQN